MMRAGQPCEISPSFVFLASDDASYMTGQELHPNGSTLTLCATHNADNSEKNSNGEYIRKERSYGSYCRSFDILGIDENAIDAAYTNGILTLTLPKKEQHPESKRIEIK